MKQAALRGVSALLLAGALFLGSGVALSAADRTGDARLYLEAGDNAGIRFSQGDAFFNMEGAVPGDTLEQTIRIDNRRNERAAFYFKASLPDAAGAQRYTDNLNMLRQLRLDLWNGSSLVYRGDLTGGANSLYGAVGNLTSGTYGIRLGEAAAGGAITLRAVIHIPLAVNNTYADKVSRINWEVRAELPDPAYTTTTTTRGGDSTVDGEPSRAATTTTTTSTPNTTTIRDEDIPLSDNLYSIPDNQTPLAALPRTGGGLLLLGVLAAPVAASSIFIGTSLRK